MAQQKATRAPAAEIPASPALLWPADKVERRPIAGLVPYARNARTHSDDQVAELARSIQAFGWTIPVLVDEAGGIIAGHGRILAAQKLGLAEVPVMVAHGWTEEQRRLYVLADNKLALNAGWDSAVLAAELGDLKDIGVDVALAGFSAVEVEDLLVKFGPQLGGDTEAIPEAPAEPVSRPGDVWIMGRHRLLCGDATDPGAWDKIQVGDGFVLFTSPPYNAGEAAKLRGKHKPGVKKTGQFYDQYSDDLSSDEYADLLRATMAAALPHVDAMVFNVQPLAGAKRALLKWMNEVSSNLVDVITWDKGHGAPHIHPGIMSSRYEWLVILSKSENASRVVPFSSWQGKFSNVYQAPPQRNNEYSAVHGATFPVHLPQFVVGDLMNRSRGVVDCFCDTGTSLIAAETLGRDGRGIELSPAYVDVAVKRWEQFTGQQATLEGTDQTFAALSEQRA